MRPGRLYLAPTIPRLPSSKLDVRALMALDEATVQTERADAAAGAAPTQGDQIARTVAQVWQDVLQTPVGGPQDDFFDVGGDSLQAITLVIQLEQALGLELPLTLIQEAPTFAGLCQALRAHRTTGYAPLVPLKAGDGSSPPVFFIHGVGGSVADLFPIARRMAYPGAVIGVQARGLGRHEAPHATVEAMAAEYLSAIKARQPNGPYYLCGYSFGGLVAFEIARRLRESGDDVGLVGLFDTTTSALAWPMPVWLAFVRRRVVRIAGRATAAPISAWPAAAWRACGRVIERLRDRLTGTQPHGPPLPAVLRSAPAGMLKVAASGLIASSRYRPGYYPGELTLFTPAGRDPALPSLQAIWRSHAEALSIVDTAGSHLTMLATPNAESAAESLTHRLPQENPSQALRKKS